MVNKAFNFFSLYKAGLLWLAVIVFNVTGGVDSVCASASEIHAAPTVAEIVESAKSYMAIGIEVFQIK